MHIKISFCLFLKLYLAGVAMVLFSSASAQNLSDKVITVNLNQVKLADALKEIGTRGEFYFSYNGQLLPKDSLVTIVAQQETVHHILVQLFHGKYEFEEQKNYMIISTPLAHLSLINTDITNDNNTYSISGVAVDELSGERLMNVSVYDKQHLAATLTDEHGYFKLKIRIADTDILRITASKIHYKETSLNFLQSVLVTTRSQVNDDHEQAQGAERDVFGRFFISTRQKIQSLNIPDFFAKRPFQFSLTPGLSTHGLFSSQVINRFSVNLAGGYTAGVNGLEVGGLFNIDKGNARYLQLAGVFNLVGGNMTGLQFAGVNNRALDTVKGVQVAGFINKAEGQVSGLQLASLNNEAHQLKGVQIGLINMVDTSHGVSIGLVNIIHNGFYKFSLYADGLINTNLSITTGTHDFYTLVDVGYNMSLNRKMYGLGLGMGHDFMLSNKVFLSAIVDFQFDYSGVAFDDRWQQAKLLVNFQATKKVSFFAGPSVNHYYREGKPWDYSYSIRTNWVGWEAGIAFNSVFKPAPETKDDSQAWYLGLASTVGVEWNSSYSHSIGAEIFTQRDLGKGLAGTLSAGYENNIPINYSYVGNYGAFFRKKFSTLPIKGGMRAYLSSRFFFGGELGILLGLNNPLGYTPAANILKPDYWRNADRNSLIGSASAGYSFKNGLETGFNFMSYFNPDSMQAQLRLAYRFKISK